MQQENTPFWLFSEAEGFEAGIELGSIKWSLALAEVYEKAEFKQASNEM
jgi:hypothetical protein